MDASQHARDSVLEAFQCFIQNVFGEACKAQVINIFQHANSCSPPSSAKLQSHLDQLIRALQNIQEKLLCEVQSDIGSSQHVHMTPAVTHTKPSSLLTRTVEYMADEASHETAMREDSQNMKVDLAKSVPTSQTSYGTEVSKLLDPTLVQIRASKAEVERRIAAFINHKQTEVDEMNVREFCYGLPDTEVSCARVDAVFVGRAGSSSHLKVTRVVNIQGPQTRVANESRTSTLTNRNRKPAADFEESIEERLRNVEDHLSVGRNCKADMFSRLKALEERVLFLEGISPEYFQSGPPPPKRQKPSPVPSQPSTSAPAQVKEYKNLSDINMRIQELQAALQHKAKQTALN